MHDHYEQYINQILYSWKEKPREVAMEIISKYGLPQEALLTRLIWYKNGPWKRTVIYRKTVPHYFPTPHEDMLEQFINYKVPVHLFDNIAGYDGSVYLDRTRGEASAKCDKEEMNFLALNLVHDIVQGERSLEDARLFYAKTAKAYIENDVTSPYIEGLLFPKQTNTADPDKSLF